MPNFQAAVVSQYSFGPNGGYIADGSGGYQMESQTAYLYDRDYAKVAGRMPARTGIRSFTIFESPTSGKFSLTINQHILGGIYPTLEAAVGALFGYFMRSNGGSDNFDVFLSNLYTTGKGILPENEGNVQVLTTRNAGLGSQVYDWNPTDSRIGEADTVYVIFEKRANSSDPWTTFEVVTSYNLFNATAGDVVTTPESISRFDSISEGEQYRASLRSFNGLTVVNPSFASTPVRTMIGPAPTTIDYDLALSNAVLGQNVNAVITNEDPASGIDFDYYWFREIPTLTGTTITNEGS